MPENQDTQNTVPPWVSPVCLDPVMRERERIRSITRCAEVHGLPRNGSRPH